MEGNDAGGALELIGVSRRFGEHVAVDDVSLSIERGGFVGLLGRNGAGKSTIIKMATGLLPVSGGRIRVLGTEFTDEESAISIKRRIGAMPEDMALLDRLTGPQFLRFVGRLYGLEDQVIDERARELGETLELAPAPGTLIADYSYGMKKKLALGSALLHGPALVFLDEPFEGIDPIAGRTIRGLLEGLRSRGVTLVLTSHMLEIVEKLCPLIAIIDKGRLLGFGTREEWRERHRGADLESVFVELMGGAKAGALSWL